MKRHRAQLRFHHRLRYRLARLLGINGTGRRGLPDRIIERAEDFPGSQIAVLREACEWTCPAPAVDSELVRAELAEDCRVKIPAFRLCSLNQVHLWSGSMLLLPTDRSGVLLESDRTRRNLEYTIVRECWRSFANRACSGEYFLAFDRWGCHYYYHWMVDSLCRFLALEKLPDTVRIIMPRQTQPFMLRSLELLGIDSSRLEPFDDQEWSLPVCHFAGKPYRPLQCSPTEVKTVRERLLAASRPAAGPPRRLYVSRARCRDRQLVNEEELNTFLQTFGFERYFPETETVDQQIQAFARAEAVVGSFGSGLTGLMFCPPETPVMVFYDHDYFDSCIWLLGNAVGLKMAGLGYDAPMPLAPDRLRPFLDRLGDLSTIG